ncbi:MAG: hypothetical protein IKI27_05340 [Methanobrevibacter sp.]|nr:hypothetical protein [Methanobrevibacter sp.]MBR7050860.1 hypothetical protein [Methanobrevibacter sp.]
MLIISASIVFIDSSMDNINQSMPSISEGIVQGDKDYNESVELLNSRYFNDANDKAISAGDNYNNSLKKLNDIKDKFNKDLNEVHKDYIDAAINELELKLRAVDELKESIYYLQNYYNYTGSTHGTQANELMYDAVEYQNQRNGIVQENPDLFN